MQAEQSRAIDLTSIFSQKARRILKMVKVKKKKTLKKKKSL